MPRGRYTYASPLPEGVVASVLEGGAPLLLFDGAGGVGRSYRTLLFTNPVDVLRADTPDELPGLLTRLDRCVRSAWIAGFVTYEAGLLLEPRLSSRYRSTREGFPLAWFGVFDAPCRIASGVCRESRETGRSLPPPGIELSALPDYEGYRLALEQIASSIAAGDTYQVNYTFFRSLVSAVPAPHLYLHLRRSQPVPFSACIDTGGVQILSFSPELFFERRGRGVVLRPMKGTAARDANPIIDRGVADALGKDPKNRAENLMVVDMLRNDLGRVCVPATVKVSRLFQVETHPTLHQMTSTIQGRLREGVGLSGLMRALFPCGSVTGAPKIRTMEIIDDLESSPRGVYCGALGFAGPGGRAVFSVPIRTLQRSGLRSPWWYGVGSGIVADSDSRQEWDECRVKCAFLTVPHRQYELVESLLWDGCYRSREGHLRRMEASAAALGFCFSRAGICCALRQLARTTLLRGQRYKVRILLQRNGVVDTECERLESEQSNRVLIERHPVDAGEPLLYHKTTWRPWYADAADRIRSGECFDVLFCNRQQQLTEGSRSTLFIRRGAMLYTPPVACGLLNGTLRQRLLDAGTCREAILHPRDLVACDEIFCGNSVRGLVSVRFVSDGKGGSTRSGSDP